MQTSCRQNLSNIGQRAAIGLLVGGLLVALAPFSVYAAGSPTLEKGGRSSPIGASNGVVSAKSDDSALTLRNLYLLKLLTSLNLTEDQLKAIPPLTTRLKTADDRLALTLAQSAGPTEDDLRAYAGSINAQRPPNPALDDRVNRLLTMSSAKEAELIAMQRQITSAIRTRLSGGQLALIRAGVIRCPAGRGLDDVEVALQLPLYDPASSNPVVSRPVSAASVAAPPAGASAPALSFAMANVVADALTLQSFRAWRDPAQDYSDNAMLGRLQHFAMTLGINPFGPQFPVLKEKVKSQMQQMQGMGAAQFLSVQGDLGSHLLRNYRNLDLAPPQMSEDAPCIRQVFLDPYVIVCLQRLSKPGSQQSTDAAKDPANPSGIAAADRAASALHLLLQDGLLTRLSSLRLSKTQCKEITGILNGLVDGEKTYRSSIEPVIRARHEELGSVNSWWSGETAYPTDALARADTAMSQLNTANDRFREQRTRAVTMIGAVLSAAQRSAISKDTAVLASLVAAAGGGTQVSGSSSENDATSSPWTNGMDGGEASALAGGAEVLDLMDECREEAPEGAAGRFRVLVDTVSVFFSLETGLSAENSETVRFEHDVADWLHAVSVMDDHSYSQLRDSIAARMRRNLNLPEPDGTVDPDAIRVLFLNQEARRYISSRSQGP